MNKLISATLFLVITIFISNLAQSSYAQSCQPSGSLIGKKAPRDQCDPSGSECCKAGKSYTTYKCSPTVTTQTKAILTLNSFEKGGDGGGASACDEKYHSDKIPVVALSTGWYAKKKRCLKDIIVSGNGRSTRAKVVDECDSAMGCDEEHGYQPPCRNNIVDGSKAVWKALGVSPKDDRYGEMDITWTPADGDRVFHI